MAFLSLAGETFPDRLDVEHFRTYPLIKIE